jgi:hypothetical protein
MTTIGIHSQEENHIGTIASSGIDEGTNGLEALPTVADAGNDQPVRPRERAATCTALSAPIATRSHPARWCGSRRVTRYPSQSDITPVGPLWIIQCP